MNTLEEKYTAQIKRENANDIQREAVADYLLKYGEINRDIAYDVGLAACGRIKNVGARIHELRADGWQIETAIRNGVCFYKLIEPPRAEQLNLL